LQPSLWFLSGEPYAIIAMPRSSVRLFRERRELVAAERRAGDAPAAFRRPGEQNLVLPVRQMDAPVPMFGV
jgi:hypothetical protein